MNNMTPKTMFCNLLYQFCPQLLIISAPGRSPYDAQTHKATLMFGQRPSFIYNA